MLIPLLLLAGLSIGGGLFGVPEVMGGGDILGHWLSSIVPQVISHGGEEMHSQEIVLMVITSLWGLHFTVLGWVIYTQKRAWPIKMAEKLGAMYRLIANRYYIDEIYDALIVRPLVSFSRAFLWKGVDDVAIDGLVVYGTARSIGVFGRLASLLQTGVLQQYLLYFLIGAVIIVGYIAL